MQKAHFYGGGIFLRRRHTSTAEAHFYGGGIFLRRRHISTAEVYFYGESVRTSIKEVNLKAIGVSLELYGKEEPMHGADEFLCRNCVILKCEAVALVSHRIGELPLERDRKF